MWRSVLPLGRCAAGCLPRGGNSADPAPAGASVRSVSAQAVCLGRVSLSCDQVIAPGSELVLKGFMPSCDYVGPALVEPGELPCGVEVVRAVVNVDRARVPVMVRNVTAEPVTLFKKCDLASVEMGFVEQAPEFATSPETDVKKLAKLDQSSLTDEQRQRVHKLLSRYADMFDGHIGFTDGSLTRLTLVTTLPSDRPPDVSRLTLQPR